MLRTIISSAIKTRLKYVLAFLFLQCFHFAQQFNFQHYKVEDGLPQSTVFELFQDKKGYLWIGTEGGGLCRYDGYRFKTYNSTDGFYANLVRKVAQDKQGDLWVATNKGLYQIHEGKIRLVDEIKDNRSIYFMNVFVDQKGQIWAGSSGNGLFCIQRSSSGALNVLSYNVDNGSFSNFIFDIEEDRNGNLWVASFGEGLMIIDKDKKFTSVKFSLPLANEAISIKRINEKEMIFGTRSSGAYIFNCDQPQMIRQVKGTEGEQVWSVACEQNVRYWVSTKNKGVLCSDSAFSIGTKQGLATNEILKLLRDRENNLWIGTNSAGLLKFSGNKFIHFTAAEFPELSFTSSFLKDKKGNFYAGSSTGLYYFSFQNGKTKLLKQHSVKDGLNDPNITCMSMDESGVLWIGTQNGLYKFQDGKFNLKTEADGLAGNIVNAVYADSRSQLWIGTPAGLSLIKANGEILNISESNGLPHNEVQCFSEDSEGNIWIGTFGGLIKYDGKVLQSFDEQDGLKEKRIQCLNSDHSGKIYIGTFGGGIYRYENKKISLLCDNSKLISNSIYSLVNLKDTVIIAGTNQGLSKIVMNANGSVRFIKNIDSYDGYKFVESNANAAIVNGENILFGTPKGISVYFPSQDRVNTVKPEIFIDEVLINGEPVNLNGRLELTSSRNTIKVLFSAVSLSNPHHNRYFAKLSGIDTNWHKLIIDKQNLSEFISVEYKKLQPGEYKLLLRASNNDGVYSAESVIEFHIEQPFYKRPAFLVFAILFILLSFYLLLKVREKKLQKEKEILEKIVEERTAEIVASKKEIEAQKDLLEIQKHEITDSINYSKRIQNAILPELNEFYNELKQAFILYKPRDIVSGDFYHFGKLKNGEFYVAAADCTGHGVPGAFMSMIGSKELSDAIKTNSEPGHILEQLNRGMRFSLKQSNPELGIKDGMDIALVSIKQTANGARVKYAGANRPFWLVKGNTKEIAETKATKTAIGGYTTDDHVFDQHEFELEKGNIFYLFSDGYADQFGGGSGKKMMTKRFKEVLLEIHSMDMNSQQEYLLNYFNEWKGTLYEQVDDILVIGIKI